MQHDFVTKKEFGEFKDEMSEFRSETKTNFSDLRAEMSSFKTEIKGEMVSFKTEIKGEMSSFRSEIKAQMNSHKDEIKGYFDRSVGVMHDKFREDVQMSMEYVQGIDKNKVDKKDFEVVRQRVADWIEKGKKGNTRV